MPAPCRWISVDLIRFDSIWREGEGRGERGERREEGREAERERGRVERATGENDGRVGEKDRRRARERGKRETDHELLHGEAVAGVRAAVDDVHPGDGHHELP